MMAFVIFKKKGNENSVEHTDGRHLSSLAVWCGSSGYPQIQRFRRDIETAIPGKRGPGIQIKLRETNRVAQRFRDGVFLYDVPEIDLSGFSRIESQKYPEVLYVTCFQYGYAFHRCALGSNAVDDVRRNTWR